MKFGHVFEARTGLEKMMMEETLRKNGVRYEVWRTRDYPEGRVFHYWSSTFRMVKINIDLLISTWKFFRYCKRRERLERL